MVPVALVLPERAEQTRANFWLCSRAALFTHRRGRSMFSKDEKSE